MCLITDMASSSLIQSLENYKFLDRKHGHRYIVENKTTTVFIVPKN